jgi:glycosyltransferase 2 family protein
VLKRLAAVLLKIVVVVVLGWLAWPHLEIAAFKANMQRISMMTAAAVLALFMAQGFIAALRWRWIIGAIGYPLPISAVLEAWLVGQCASQILPAVIGGDAVRVLRLHSYAVPLPVSAISVFIDRFAGLVVLVLMAMVSLPILVWGTAPHALPVAVVWVIGFCCLLTIIAAFCLRRASIYSTLRLPPVFDRAQQALRRIPIKPKAMLLLAATGFGTNFTVVLSAFLLGRELDSAIDLLNCFALLPLVTLLTFVPISIAGWGVRDAGMIAAFGLFDVPAAAALAVSIELGLANLALGLIGGIFWLLSPGSSRRVRRVSTDMVPPCQR